jgi:hypothetical protein
MEYSDRIDKLRSNLAAARAEAERCRAQIAAAAASEAAQREAHLEALEDAERAKLQSRCDVEVGRWVGGSSSRVESGSSQVEFGVESGSSSRVGFLGLGRMGGWMCRSVTVVVVGHGGVRVGSGGWASGRWEGSGSDVRRPKGREELGRALDAGLLFIWWLLLHSALPCEPPRTTRSCVPLPGCGVRVVCMVAYAVVWCLRCVMSDVVWLLCGGCFRGVCCCVAYAVV